MTRKPLIDRIKKVQCQHMIPREEYANLYCRLPLEIEWQRIEMYNKIIEELCKNHFIEETIEDTPDYKRISMRLLVVEPEEFDEE